jgi:hypothetical protein
LSFIATGGSRLARTPSGQLDLFAWRPPKRELVQLDLFGEPPKGSR